MFKRVTKRQKKREQEEELGIDDDARQMFGLQDTDSDETSSQSDSDSDNELDPGDGAEMRTEWLAAEAGSSEDEDESDEGGLDIELDDEPPMVLEEAMKNPIYHISSENLKDLRACIVCPRKLLKNDKMVELHLSSTAHVRRFKKFCELAKASNERSKDPRNIAASISQKPTAATNSDGLSKRARKRKQKLESIKRKRETTKRIIQRKKRKRDKKEAEAGENDTVLGEEKNSDAGSNKSRPPTSASDQQSSERRRKKRKVADFDGKESFRENAGGVEGGDSTKAGHQTETTAEVVAAGPKPPNAKSKKSKAKGKSESAAKAKPDTDSGKNDGGERATSSATKREQGNSPKVVRFFEDDGTIQRTDDDVGSSQVTKKRDLEKLRTKGHMGRAGAGKFAKLSNTRSVKDKSQRKPQSQGDTARKSPVPKKSTRYFDEAEDGTPVGPKPSSDKKQHKKRKSEGKELKRNNSA